MLVTANRPELCYAAEDFVLAGQEAGDDKFPLRVVERGKQRCTGSPSSQRRKLRWAIGNSSVLARPVSGEVRVIFMDSSDDVKGKEG